MVALQAIQPHITYDFSSVTNIRNQDRVDNSGGVSKSARLGQLLVRLFGARRRKADSQVVIATLFIKLVIRTPEADRPVL